MRGNTAEKKSGYGVREIFELADCNRIELPAVQRGFDMRAMLREQAESLHDIYG